MSLERTWELLARKLAGEASEQELGELDLLLKSNPQLHFPIQIISGLWQQQPETDISELEAAFRKHLKRMEEQGISFAATNGNTEEPATFHMPEQPAGKIWKYVTVAACLLLISGLIWYYSPSAINEQPKGSHAKNTNTTNEIITRNGSRTHINLPDGSKVWLNAGSKLNYDKSFGTQNRDIRLTGEAYFDVVKNPRLPFVIHTDRMEVRVLGTSFNVRAYPGDKTSEAALVQGSIEVMVHSAQSGKFILKPNQKIIVGQRSEPAYNTAKQTIKQDSAVRYDVKQLTLDETDKKPVETAWVENKLVFIEEPFADVARKIERWYGVSISFSNSTLEKIPLTGSFTIESVDEALYALSLAAGFSYKKADSKTIVIGKQTTH